MKYISPRVWLDPIALVQRCARLAGSSQGSLPFDMNYPSREAAAFAKVWQPHESSSPGVNEE